MNQIGKGFRLAVHWYDNVPEPPENETFEGEVVGWRQSQVIVRVKNYAVLRFWKRNGSEVGNPDHARRGFKIDLADLNPSTDGKQPGVAVTLKADMNQIDS